MGAGATLARVHAPMLRSSLVTAALLVFVDVMKELPATFVMRPFNFDTLAVQAYNLAADERRDLGQVADAADFHAVGGERLTGPVGGDDLDAEPLEAARQRRDAGAIGDGQQGSHGRTSSHPADHRRGRRRARMRSRSVRGGTRPRAEYSVRHGILRARSSHPGEPEPSTTPTIPHAVRPTA